MASSGQPFGKGLTQWFGNIVSAVLTVAHALWVTLRYWLQTYGPSRKTFTEHFEYPELPLPVRHVFGDSTVTTSPPASPATVAPGIAP